MTHNARMAAPRVLLAALVFIVAAAAAPEAARAYGPPCGSFYTVHFGDTMASIAARCGVSMQALMQANGMASSYAYAGRSLYMPRSYMGGYGPAYAPPVNGSNNYGPAYAPPAYGSNGYGSAYAPPAYGSNGYGSVFVYRVMPGDTLFGIARRFGVSEFALVGLNHLFNPNVIFAGMRLLIPRAGNQQTPRVYIVNPGDTLTRIAIRFGTTVWALVMENNLPNPNLIFVGMRLIIPGSAGYSPYGNAPAPYSNPASPYGNPPAPYVMPTPTPTAGAMTSSVSLRNMAYNPQTITIRAGTTVVWTNDEVNSMPHTVTSGAPGAPNGIFDSGTLTPGQSFQFTFNSPGTFPYYCRIHGAAMTGTVVVTP